MNYNQNENTPAISASAATTCPSAPTTPTRHIHTLRIQEVGPLGRRFFINTRLNINWGHTSSAARRSRRGHRFG